MLDAEESAQFGARPKRGAGHLMDGWMLTGLDKKVHENELRSALLPSCKLPVACIWFLAYASECPT